MAPLEANFLVFGRLVALDTGAYRSLVRQAPKDGITGGRIYDAVIARCALRAGASMLLTFNQRHFRTLALAGIAIVVPGARPVP